MVTMTVRTDLTRIQRTNLETCITVHMHQKESTEDLVRRKVGGILLFAACRGLLAAAVQGAGKQAIHQPLVFCGTISRSDTTPHHPTTPGQGPDRL